MNLNVFGWESFKYFYKSEIALLALFGELWHKIMFIYS